MPIAVGALFIFADSTTVLASRARLARTARLFFGFFAKLFIPLFVRCYAFQKQLIPQRKNIPFPPSRRKAEEYLVEKKRDLDRAVRADPVQFPKRERIENAAYERVESLHARTQKNELILHTARNKLPDGTYPAARCAGYRQEESQ